MNLLPIDKWILQSQENTVDCINQFNKDYQVLEDNVKLLMLENKQIKSIFYIYILISIFFMLLAAYVIVNLLNI